LLHDVAPSATAVANPGDVLGVRVRVQVRTSTGVTARLRVGMRVRVGRRVRWACLMRAVKRTALVLAALALLMAVGVSRPAPASALAPMECGPSAPCEATVVQDASGHGSSGPVAVAAFAAPPTGPMAPIAGTKVWMESTQRRCPCPPAPEHDVWPD
jgi:hypothetical protein